MRIVFFGYDGFAVPTLVKLANSDHEVVWVVSRPNEDVRDGILSPSPVAVQAENWDLPVIDHEKLNTPELVDEINSLKSDLGIVVGSGPELPEPLRNAFEVGCIGIHPSLLPKYRGPSPIARAILNGEKKTGITVFRITAQPYAGPVIIQRETVIRPDETYLELRHRLAGVACDAVDAALQKLIEDRHFVGVRQDESQATWAPELSETEGFIRFDNESAEKIVLKCRAAWPFSGARTKYVNMKGEAENLRIVRARAVSANAQVLPGTVTPELNIATIDGELEIEYLELSDKRTISWQDFVKERQVLPGDRFEPIAR